MTLRLGIGSIVVLLLLVAGAVVGQAAQPWQSPQPATQPHQVAPPAQTQPAYGQPQYAQQPPYGQPSQTYPPTDTQSQPGQPVGQPGQGLPMMPPAAPTAPAAPPWADQLTPQQLADVDRVLKAWETYGDRVEMFETEFARRTYEPDWESRQPGAVRLKTLDMGVLKYKKPDKGFFEIKGERAEKWICDGQSIYEYDFAGKQLTQHLLPAEMRGKPFGDGPVPFVFGAKADKMKSRYWIRVLKMPQNANEPIWLEVWPRHQDDAADFRRAEVKLSATDLRPVGVLRYLTGGQQVRTADGQIRTLGGSYETYTFDKTVINPKDLFRFFQGDPFTARMDRGWTKVVKAAAAPATQASRSAPGGGEGSRQ